jgi:peptidoglycan/xylan/chitin deacetylase (PgdA/CDA1 family)
MRPGAVVGNRHWRCAQSTTSMALAIMTPSPIGSSPLSLCRADKFLLASAAATVGSAAVFGPSILSVGVPFGAHALLMADGIFRPDSSILYPTLVRGRTDQPRVALTFDDGPDPEITPAVLNLLAEYDARATFFVIGRYLEKHRALGERIYREGHELGNHSWQHSYLLNFSSAAGHGAEIDRCSQLIKSVTQSEREPLYRPPVGLKSPAMARAAHQRNLDVVAWSIHSRDTFARDPRAVANGVARRIGPGDIVLLHDGHDREHQHRPLILEALPLLLQALRERGLTSVTVSELLNGTQPATPAPNGARLAADDGRN